jgi:murein DD-endopeptidase MepM/ murein hydrolase activator NlpD
LIAPVSMAGGFVSPGPDPTRSAGEQLEAMFLKQLLEFMPLPGIEGTGAETWAGLYREMLANEIAAKGDIGLSAQIDAALERQGGGLSPSAPLVPAAFHRSSGFGYRSDPFDGDVRMHSGVDLSAPEGTPVRAVADGVVRFAGRRDGYGQVVVIDHADGSETRYAHCRALHVRSGDVVRQGDRIGEVGQTGRATGPHLHFELRIEGRAVDPGGLADFPQLLGGAIR